MNDLFIEAAHGSMGYYPQEVWQNGVRVSERTPYQEGWNAAVYALIERYQCILAWAATLPIGAVTALRTLLEADAVFLRVEHEAVICRLIMNDVFGYACADAEPVPDAALITVAALWQRNGWGGLIAWASIQRNEEPIKERLTDAYYAASAAITEAGQ